MFLSFTRFDLIAWILLYFLTIGHLLLRSKTFALFLVLRTLTPGNIDPDAGRDWGQEEKGTTEDEMAGWHHWLDGREFGWTLEVGDGQGGLACCDSLGRKESDTTERLNWTEWTHKLPLQWIKFSLSFYFLSFFYCGISLGLSRVYLCIDCHCARHIEKI